MRPRIRAGLGLGLGRDCFLAGTPCCVWISYMEDHFDESVGYSTYKINQLLGRSSDDSVIMVV